MTSEDPTGISTDSDLATSIDLTRGPLSAQFAAVYTLIACLAVLGNGLVIAVMLLRRRVFSSLTNRLILHQSVIDCVAGVVFFTWGVVFDINPKTVLRSGNTFDQFLCRFIQTDIITWCMNVTSTYNLVTISLERFMATCHPVKHRNSLSVAKLRFAMATAWAIGFIYGCGVTFGFEVNEGKCRPAKVGTALNILHVSAVFIVEYLLPVTVLLYTYGRIVTTLSKKCAYPANRARSGISQAKKNVLVTTLLISIMFVVCWTPTEVLYTYDQLSGNWNQSLYDIFIGMVGCNMLTNPVIYCFKYQKFRVELRQLVVQRLRGNRVEDGGTVSMTAASSRFGTNVMPAVQSS